MRKSTIIITKGKDFTSISFEKPIKELKKYAYNGSELLKTIDIRNVKTFWNKGQTLDLYDGRQLLYSCSIAEIKHKNKWQKVILDAWNKDGQKIFDYENEFKRLLDKI